MRGLISIVHLLNSADLGVLDDSCTAMPYFMGVKEIINFSFALNKSLHSESNFYIIRQE